MKQPVKNLSVRIPVELLNKFRVTAKQDCRSTSSMVRVLIADYIRKFEEEHGEII